MMESPKVKMTISEVAAYNRDMARCWEELARIDRELFVKNNLAKRLVRRLINYKFTRISEILNDLTWEHEGFVEVVKTDSYKSHHYPNHEFYKIKGEHKHFMKQDVEGKFHTMVWQTTHMEDSYSGWMLFPLQDGRYWKINYSC